MVPRSLNVSFSILLDESSLLVWYQFLQFLSFRLINGRNSLEFFGLLISVVIGSEHLSIHFFPQNKCILYRNQYKILAGPNSELWNKHVEISFLLSTYTLQGSSIYSQLIDWFRTNEIWEYIPDYKYSFFYFCSLYLNHNLTFQYPFVLSFLCAIKLN